MWLYTVVICKYIEFHACVIAKLAELHLNFSNAWNGRLHEISQVGLSGAATRLALAGWGGTPLLQMAEKYDWHGLYCGWFIAGIAGGVMLQPLPIQGCPIAQDTTTKYKQHH